MFLLRKCAVQRELSQHIAKHFIDLPIHIRIQEHIHEFLNISLKEIVENAAQLLINQSAQGCISILFFASMNGFENCKNRLKENRIMTFRSKIADCFKCIQRSGSKIIHFSKHRLAAQIFHHGYPMQEEFPGFCPVFPEGFPFITDSCVKPAFFLKQLQHSVK